MNRRNLHHRRNDYKKRNLSSPVLLLWLYAAFSVHTHATEVFQDLEPGEVDVITRLCTHAQFQDGADAYRDCLTEQLARSTEALNPASTALAALPLDEQFAIQRACTQANPASAIDDNACIAQQLVEIEEQSAPELSKLKPDEQYVVSQQCFEAQTSSGVSAYRECVSIAIESLTVWPEALFTNQSATGRNNIQLECSLFSADVASYRKCLLTALGVAFDDNITTDAANNLAAVSVDTLKPALESTLSVEAEAEAEAEAINIAPESNVPKSVAQETASPPAQPLSSDAVNQREQVVVSPADQEQPANLIDATAQLATSDSDLDNTAPQSNAAFASNSLEQPEVAEPLASDSTQEITPDNAPENTSALHQAQNLWQVIKGRIETFSTNQRVAIFATLLIALLTVSLVLIGKPAQHDSLSHNKKTHSKKSSKRGTKRRSRILDAPATPDLAPVDPNYIAHLKGEANLGGTPGISAKTSAPDNAASPLRQQLDANVVADRTTQIKDNFSTERKRFCVWLNDFPQHTQQEFAIELLIYWMAYADNRFDPLVKRRVLQMKDPDNRSLIKRWAFLNDAHALSDAIGFVQTYASSEQREQIIDLLMAMLVNEHALTPIQNNLLRFLGDAFGLGVEGVNRQYNRAFGCNLPAIPRPDKIVWWNKVSADQQLRWDARAIAIQPDNIRHRIALGQPLKGTLNKEAILASFNLSAGRCHHARVSKLGERELLLMNTQLKKFEHARDALLELVS